MKAYSEVEKMLDKIVDDTPQELYRELTGGVILSEGFKLHSGSLPGNPLFVLGEYHHDMTGRYIVIYFGSFNIVYGYLPDAEFYEKLRHTFAHEMRHHMEQLSGIRDLDRFDEERYRRYVSGEDIAGFHEPEIPD